MITNGVYHDGCTLAYYTVTYPSHQFHLQPLICRLGTRPCEGSGSETTIGRVLLLIRGGRYPRVVLIRNCPFLMLRVLNDALCWKKSGVSRTQVAVWEAVLLPDKSRSSWSPEQ